MSEHEIEKNEAPADQSAPAAPSITFTVTGPSAQKLFELQRKSGTDLRAIIERAIDAEVLIHNHRVQGLALFGQDPKLPRALLQIPIGAYAPLPQEPAPEQSEPAPAEEAGSAE